MNKTGDAMLLSFWKKYGPLSIAIAISIAFFLPMLIHNKQDLKLILLLFSLALSGIIVGHFLAQLFLGEEVQAKGTEAAAEKTEEFQIPIGEEHHQLAEDISQLLFDQLHQDGVFLEEKEGKKDSSDSIKPAI